jgi:regulatory protein
MSSSNPDSDPPRASRPARAPRKARPKPSLKMQAIGYLSRREHSRQELRQKLLASLRQREREAAALAAASEAAARELAEAIGEQPSNGIDDAFAPPATAVVASTGRGRVRGREASTVRATSTDAEVATPRVTRAGAAASALANLRFADGAAIPARLRSELSSLADKPVAETADRELAVAHDAELGEEAAATLEQQDPEAFVDRLLDWLVANKYLSEPRFVESRVNARARKQGAMMIKHELRRHGLVLEPEQAAALRETEFARAQALWQRKFGEVASDARMRAKQARFLAARGFAADVVRRIVGGEEES